MRPTRIRLQFADGSFVDLDRETSKRIYERADERGVLVLDVIRELFKKGYDAMMAVN